MLKTSGFHIRVFTVIQSLVLQCLGSHLLTFGCDAFVTLSKVLHFVCGAIQSGSMMCLENVTRVPAPVLSVLGQHLESVRHALRFLEEKSFSEYQSRGFREKANIPEEVRWIC